MNAKAIFLTIATLALSGCGGEPSQTDIENVLTKEIEKAQGLIALTGGKFVLHSVTKEQCTKINKIWECHVTVDSTKPLLGRSTATDVLKLIKGDSGWIAVSR